jgi:hypothetical protein
MHPEANAKPDVHGAELARRTTPAIDAKRLAPGRLFATKGVHAPLSSVVKSRFSSSL